MVFALIGIVILFVIFYSMGKFDTGGSWDVLNRDNHITEGVPKFVSAGVTTFVLDDFSRYCVGLRGSS